MMTMTMRSTDEEKGNANGGTQHQLPPSFEFHNNPTLTRTPSHHHHHRTTTALGKPTPSKWDDAQKWLVNLSRGGAVEKASPRNSNADDRRLMAHVPPPKEDVQVVEVDTETKDCVVEEESIWRINKHVIMTSTTTNNNTSCETKSVCVRDTGTEMTPLASQEPSRTATPIRAARSPISSATSTPDNHHHHHHHHQTVVDCQEWTTNNNNNSNNNNNGKMKMNSVESRAAAWEEAERAKYMARYKREEVKIQAWENHQKRKAEMEMRKLEVKAERLKSRAQEKYNNRVAAARRIAEEKRANAEGKLNEKGVKTSERADYIRRTGRLPHSLFSFNRLPTLCW